MMTTCTYRIIVSNSAGSVTSNGAQLAVFLPTDLSQFTNGLIAYYPFNGNANDESGNGRHGTPTGPATLAADRYGSANRAYDFNGSGKVSLPAFNYGSQFTISAWVNFDADNRTHLIITKKPADAIDSVALTFQDGKFKAVVFSSNNVFIGRSAQNTTPSVGVWSHLTFTFDGGTTPSAIKIYKDGVRIDDSDLSLGSFTTFNDLNVASEIGSQNSGAGAADGKFDDYRIYNRALSPDEVKRLRDLELGLPSIHAPPQSITVNADANATFSVGAADATGYQWQKDGANIAGANASTLSLSNVTGADAGQYRVSVSNAAGSINSSEATLTVIIPPVITSQPADWNATVGTNVSFDVNATGTTPFTYQWQKNGVDINGSTAATLNLTNVQLGDSGNYRVKVSNGAGSMTSNAALLTVGTAPAIVSQPVDANATTGNNVTLQRGRQRHGAHQLSVAEECLQSRWLHREQHSR